MVDISQANERLTNLIAKMTLECSYWGFLFSRIQRRPSETLRAVMGVAPERNGTVTLYYNPKMFMDIDNVTALKVFSSHGNNSSSSKNT